MNNNYDSKFLKLRHPFTFCCVGPTGCGKTVFIKKLLKNVNTMFDPIPEKIIYVYSIWQNIYTEILQEKPSIEFIQENIDIESLDSDKINLLVLDDLMEETKNSQDVSKIFTKASHHRNISVILITQNLFVQGKQTRTISLNTHYMSIFKNPRDKAQFSFLARQMFPGNSKFLSESYEDATKTPHGFIFLDIKQDTPDCLRVRANILDKESIVYVKK